ncbi:MAG: ribonuclease H-like domain-containing protein [Chloroflexota bacterium]
MTAEPLPAVTRERRLANLRATLERPGGAPAGPSQPPARAPFSGRRSGELAMRLARALGAEAADTPDGWLVRRVIAPLEIPVDRERLALLPGHPPADAPLVCLDTETTGLATAAGTLAFLVGLARWDGSSFRQTQLLLPDHADERAMLAEIERWVTPDAWLVTYNGRGFDWPLIEARFRLAGRAAPLHAGHLDMLPFVRRVFRHRMEDARLRTVEERLLGVAHWEMSRGWEIPAIYLDVLQGGPSRPLAGVVSTTRRTCARSACCSPRQRRYVERETRLNAPRGSPAGLARAYARDRRHEEALACLDDLRARRPRRDGDPSAERPSAGTGRTKRTACARARAGGRRGSSRTSAGVPAGRLARRARGGTGRAARTEPERRDAVGRRHGVD